MEKLKKNQIDSLGLDGKRVVTLRQLNHAECEVKMRKGAIKSCAVIGALAGAIGGTVAGGGLLTKTTPELAICGGACYGAFVLAVCMAMPTLGYMQARKKLNGLKAQNLAQDDEKENAW